MGFVELLRQARQGETTAVESLLERVQSILDRPGRRADRDGGLSWSDASQEILMRVWSHLDQFRGSDDDERCELMFAKWIRQTAQNVVLNLRAREQARKRRPPGPRHVLEETRAASPNEETPSAAVASLEQKIVLREALDSLADVQSRDILKLRFVDGLSLRQITDRVQLTYDQVRHRFHAALRELAGHLDPH